MTATLPAYPIVNTDVIPSEMLDRQQWVAWRWEQRKGKPTKVPTIPMTDKKNASPTNPTWWRSFDEALATSIGIGYVFTADDGLVGIDLDRCHDPETGTVERWAKEIVEALGTYAEVTPSGTGLHLIG